MASAGCVVDEERGDDGDVRSHLTQTRKGVAQIAKAADRQPRQQFEFKVVRRDDIGRSQRPLHEEVRHARLHEHAGARVADDRIAAIQRRRIVYLGPRHGAQDGVARFRRAQIA